MTGHTARGVWLSLITVGCWSVIPITLRIAARHMDPYTVTWYRFLVSALILGVILGAKGELPSPARILALRPMTLLVVGTVGLVGNYVLYLMSLSYVSPTISTVITQLGPILLIVGGILLFGEHLNRRQGIGVALLLAGLLLFFNRRIVELADYAGRAGTGAIILVVAAVGWAVYGLAQKVLVRRFAPTQVLLLIYAGATLMLAASIAPRSLETMPPLELTMLGLSALNTLVAYGALAEALRHARVSTVGAVLAIGPVATLVVTWTTNRLSPGFFEPDLLNVATVAGAFVVTLGSALTASG